jgi:hypothetical protein
MNWREVQLGTTLCDQDIIIKQLIGNNKVRLHGEDAGFQQFCRIDPTSQFCLIFFQNMRWLSEIKRECADFLSYPTSQVYVGINRYTIKGNDTFYSLHNSELTNGSQILSWTSDYIKTLGFTTIQQGCFEFDRGKYFNFVQPLTWIYAEK